MRLASFRSAEAEGYGAIVDDGVIDLGRRLPALPTLRHAIAAGTLQTLRDAARGRAPTTRSPMSNC